MPLFDELFAIDDNSTDGTVALLKEAGAHVIVNSIPNFSNESQNKRILLEEVLKTAREGDAIMWLDADEVIYASKSELLSLVESAFSKGYDSISLHHLNLWRSSTWFRTDDNYDALNPARLWKASAALFFPNSPGLHGQMYPAGLAATFHSEDYPVFHYGFASNELIIAKYVQYWRNWQSGYPLNRLISESGLALNSVQDYSGNLGSRWVDPVATEERPLGRESRDWFQDARLAKKLATDTRSSQPPRVTIVSLIYKGLDWLEFQYGEMLKLQREFERGEIELLFVANDASEEIKSFLANNLIPHVICESSADPNEWYINSVYRGYNFGASAASGDYLLLVNSDMAYSRGFLRKLVARANADVLQAGRLVERGILASGKFGIEKDLGSSPRRFFRRNFEKFANEVAQDRLDLGGLYMPVLVNKKTFHNLGGFPEGNVTARSLGCYLAGGSPQIALQGEDQIPGDRALMAKADLLGVKHQTNFGAIAYHFQQGEMKGKLRKGSLRSGVAVVNDLYFGINGEEVLWGRLVSKLRSNGLRVVTPRIPAPKTLLGRLFAPFTLSLAATKCLRSSPVRVTFSNASYSYPLRDGSLQITLTQDEPAGKLLQWLLRRKQAVSKILTNAPNVFEKNLGRGAELVNVDLAQSFREKVLVSKADFEAKGPLKMIFVGALNETKGWSQVQQAIDAHPDVHFTVVSKYNLDSTTVKNGSRSNVTFRHSLSQSEVLEEMLSADFLVSASPYETQHLVSLEAICLDRPVLISPTGFLGSSNYGICEFGVVGNSLSDSISLIKRGQHVFEPRAYASKKGLLEGNGEIAIEEAIRESLEKSFMPDLGKFAPLVSRLRLGIIDKYRFLLRAVVMPRLLGARKRFLR
jgi:glycosyltransferase involved in cell wall biosynthesis